MIRPGEEWVEFGCPVCGKTVARLAPPVDFVDPKHVSIVDDDGTPRLVIDQAAAMREWQQACDRTLAFMVTQHVCARPLAWALWKWRNRRILAAYQEPTT